VEGGKERRNGRRVKGGRGKFGRNAVGGAKWEDDKRERDGTCMGGKEVGGGGKWRGGRELRGEDGGVVQEGREHAKKGERWGEGKEGWG